jgi:hypothetical protein
LQDTPRICYVDLGLYKELNHFFEAKAWRMNELVIFTIHLAEVTKDVIDVLAIDILPLFSKGRNNHIHKIMTSTLWNMAYSNLVDLPVGFYSELKQDYGSKTRERKNSDTKDRSFNVMHALPLIASLAFGTFVFCQIDLLFQVVG